jgi:hypothetical protein
MRVGNNDGRRRCYRARSGATTVGQHLQRRAVIVYIIEEMSLADTRNRRRSYGRILWRETSGCGT